MTDGYARLARFVLLSKSMALNIVSMFMNDWEPPYESLNTVLMDIRAQFICKYLGSLCAFSGSKLLTKTVYDLQMTGQVEKLNKRIIAQLPR